MTALVEKDEEVRTHDHVDLVPQVQGRVGPAMQSLAGNTMDHLMRKWAVREALGLLDQPVETIRRYYFCTDSAVEKFKTTDERIREVIDGLEPGDEVSHAWTYVELDGRKTIPLTEEMRRNHELVERHDSRTRRPARVIVARGIVLRKRTSNSGRGKTLFGEIALGLMNRVGDGEGFDFGFALAGLIKYDKPERLYVDRRLSEAAWVSRAINVRFRGAGTETSQGSLA